jgi:hypothetical protein
MKYIISTHSFLILVNFSEDWDIQDYQVLSKGYHFGISVQNCLMKKNGDMVSAESNQSIDTLTVYRGGKSGVEQNEMSLLTFKTNGEVVSNVPISGNLGDVHQLAYANGGIYIANTRYNRITFQSLDSNFCQEYAFHGLDYDRNHINSVFPSGNQIFVILHNLAYSESELAILYHDPISGFELKHVLSLWNVGCHNVFVDGDYLFYNASQKHHFVVVDLKNDRIAKRISFTGWHTKGISVTDKYIVVGLSEHTFRDKRLLAQGKLAVMDKNSLSTLRIVDLDFPDLPHPIGNVNEIRCLSEVEMAQARPSETRINWGKLKFAKQNRVSHSLNRARIRTLLPLRQFKGYLRAVIK